MSRVTNPKMSFGLLFLIILVVLAARMNVGQPTSESTGQVQHAKEAAAEREETDEQLNNKPDMVSVCGFSSLLVNSNHWNSFFVNLNVIDFIYLDPSDNKQMMASLFTKLARINNSF